MSTQNISEIQEKLAGQAVIGGSLWLRMIGDHEARRHALG